MSRRRPPEVGYGTAPILRAEPQDGIGWGLRIQRDFEPRLWREQLEKVPAKHRAEAERYLRGIAARMRNVQTVKAAKGEE